MNWRTIVELKLAEFAGLPSNWNSYGAGPITEPVIIRTLALLDAVMLPETPAPSLVPMSTDGVQFEWHARHFDIEVSVHPPGQNIEVWSELNGAHDMEFEIRTNPSRLRCLIRRFTKATCSHNSCPAKSAGSPAARRSLSSGRSGTAGRCK